MHSGFSAMRGSLPMNLKAHFKGFKVWSRAQSDIDRVVAIWQECLQTYGGPYLFGDKPCMADAMYPASMRFAIWSGDSPRFRTPPAKRRGWAAREPGA